VVLAVWASTKSNKIVFSAKTHPLDTGYHMLSQKLLEYISVVPCTSGKRPSEA
jgi:hypothetical protein